MNRLLSAEEINKLYRKSNDFSPYLDHFNDYTKELLSTKSHAKKTEIAMSIYQMLRIIAVNNLESKYTNEIKFLNQENKKLDFDYGILDDLSQLDIDFDNIK